MKIKTSISDNKIMNRDHDMKIKSDFINNKASMTPKNINNDPKNINTISKLVYNNFIINVILNTCLQERNRSGLLPR